MSLCQAARGGGYKELFSPVLRAAAPAAAHLSTASTGIFNPGALDSIFQEPGYSREMSRHWSNSVLFLQDLAHSRYSTNVHWHA